MDKYISVKIILAEPMDLFTFCSTVRPVGGMDPVIDSQGKSQEGYKVQYEDGYVSWCPKKAFDLANRKISESELALLQG